MWNFSALHPTLHLGSVQARTAGGSIYARTHQLLLAYWLVPVSGHSWQKPSKREGRTDGKYMTRILGGKIPCCSPDLRAISEKGTDSEGFLCCARRQEQTIQATLHSAPSPEIQPLVPFTGKDGLLSGSPFSQVGWKHCLSPALSPAHWPFKFDKPPIASFMSDIFFCQASVWPLLPF